jgi:NADH:ubiquinone oxidoreductase subunit 4 (subunit M)
VILTAIWLLPAVGAVAVAFTPARLAKVVGALFGVATLALTLVVAVAFDPGHHGYQFEQNVPWIPQFGVSYHVGVDGISLWLLVLNGLLTVIAVLATSSRMRRISGFVSMLLLLEAGMAGLFLAADLLLFYVFWEAMLIPAYFLLWLWGENQGGRPAAIKFILYTLVGSLLALVIRRRRRSSSGSSSCSPWPSPSRSRCSRSTAGFPTPTGWRPPPSWSPSRASWARPAPTPCCASWSPSSPIPRGGGTGTG